MRHAAIAACLALGGCNGILGIEEPTRVDSLEPSASAGSPSGLGQGGSGNNGGAGSAGAAGSAGSGNGGGGGGSSGAGGSGGGGSEATTCGGLDQPCCDGGDACEAGLGCGVESATCVRCGFFAGMGAGNAVIRGISNDGAFVAANINRSGFRGYRWSRESGAVALEPQSSLAVAGMSADGQTLAASALGRAYRWTQAQGAEDLGDIGTANALDGYSAFGISADGEVIMGVCSGANGCPDGNASSYRGFRSSASDEGVMEDLGDLPGTPFATVRNYPAPHAISGDGSVIVGQSGARGFRWSAAGMQDLGELPGATGCDPKAISTNGVVIVGSSGGRAFRAALGEAFSPLGALPFASADGSSALAVSADGSVIAGVAPNQLSLARAFRWTAAEGMQDLGVPAGAPSDSTVGIVDALSISGDGSVIVGSYTPSGQSARAFRWSGNVMQDAVEALPEGVVPAGWQLSAAVAVSGDGRVFAGYGTNPGGLDEGWVGAVGEACEE
jgi:probable HAF family extracellular repeat protein